MRTPGPIASPRSRGIDALRGAAVPMVLLHHAYAPGIGIALYDGILEFFRRYGALGVDLFFVLSGFCIHNAYSKSDESLDMRNYGIRRWWRIYPPYFVALILALALNLTTNWIKWKTGGVLTPENYAPAHILAHVFLVHNLSPRTELTVSGPFWTIAMEAQYYLLYPLVRPFFFSAKGWGKIFLAGLAVYGLAWWCQQQPWTIQPLSPFRYWIEWLLGAYAVYLLRKNPSLPSRVGRHVFWAVICLAAGAGLEWAAAKPWMPDTRGMLPRLFYAGGFVFLIFLVLSRERVWDSKGLRWLAGIGVFSYSVYLTHFLFLDRFRVFILPHVTAGWLKCGASIAAVLGCLAAAYVFFLYFEKPFLERAARVPKRG